MSRLPPTCTKMSSITHKPTAVKGRQIVTVFVPMAVIHAADIDKFEGNDTK